MPSGRAYAPHCGPFRAGSEAVDGARIARASTDGPRKLAPSFPPVQLCWGAPGSCPHHHACRSQKCRARAARHQALCMGQGPDEDGHGARVEQKSARRPLSLKPPCAIGKHRALASPALAAPLLGRPTAPSQRGWSCRDAKSRSKSCVWTARRVLADPALEFITSASWLPRCLPMTVSRQTSRSCRARLSSRPKQLWPPWAQPQRLGVGERKYHSSPRKCQRKGPCLACSCTLPLGPSPLCRPGHRVQRSAQPEASSRTCGV